MIRPRFSLGVHHWDAVYPQHMMLLNEHMIEPSEAARGGLRHISNQSEKLFQILFLQTEVTKAEETDQRLWLIMYRLKKPLLICKACVSMLVYACVCVQGDNAEV